MKETRGLKVMFLFITLIDSIIFTLLPIYQQLQNSKKFQQNTMLTSIANVFAAGIFLAVALMDLLPEGNEILKDRVSEFDSLGYLMCITGYALILFVEKVLFDTHALIEHKHELDTRNNSVNHQQNLRPAFGMSFEDNEEVKQHLNDIDSELKKSLMHETTYSDITIYLLSIALSVHSLFDGLGLGLQNSVDSVVNIGVAVSIHKIPAAMALGVSLIKAERKKSLIMISIFCIATPLGIAIGIGLTSFGAEILIGIIVTLSSGTFIYIATTEVIVEEFSKPDHKYYKFIAFFVGVGIFTTLKSVLGGD